MHAPYMVKLLSSLTNKQAREEFILDESSWEFQEQWSTEQIKCEHYFQYTSINLLAI